MPIMVPCAVRCDSEGCEEQSQAVAGAIWTAAGIDAVAGWFLPKGWAMQPPPVGQPADKVVGTGVRVYCPAHVDGAAGPRIVVPNLVR